MATLTAEQTFQTSAKPARGFGAFARFALCAVAPLAAFGGVNLVAEALGYMPLFFSPLGLPGWFGAAIHLVILFSLGLALGLVAEKGRRGANVARWLAPLMAAVILFPFFAAPLDSLSLALMMTSVMILALATSLRVARISRLGGWLMVPSLIWLGFGAALGLAIAAAWSPPFALVTAQQPPAAAV